jgi:hypothetical protein
MKPNNYLLLNGVFLSVLILLTPYAEARDAEQDCEVLKQIISDAKNSFRNIRQESEVHDMGTSKTYPVRVEFDDSQWCSVVISTNFFNENYSCDLRSTSVEDAASLVVQCLDKTALPDPKYQSDHFKVFKLTTEDGGTVGIYQGAFADLVKISVHAAEPE